MSMTTEQVEKLLSDATPGPWAVHGDYPWNLTVNSDPHTRICFLSHSNGLNDDRDFAKASLIAAAPELASEVIALRKRVAELEAKP